MNNFVTSQERRLFILLLALAVMTLARPSDANSAEYQRIVAIGLQESTGPSARDQRWPRKIGQRYKWIPRLI